MKMRSQKKGPTMMAVYPMTFGAPPSAEAGPSVKMPLNSGRPELPWMEINLPTPPSVNRFMAKLGNKSPVVKNWIERADGYFLAQKRRLTKIIGPFEAQFIFSEDTSDFHNREKCLFDYLQRVELIQNDRLCRWRASGWGTTMVGVKVRLRPWCPK